MALHTMTRYDILWTSHNNDYYTTVMFYNLQAVIWDCLHFNGLEKRFHFNKQIANTAVTSSYCSNNYHKLFLFSDLKNKI